MSNAAPVAASADVSSPVGDPLAGAVPLESAEQLREILGDPWPIVIDKVHDELTEADLGLLARAPFCAVSTSDADGNCDTSPRGGAAGFTRVLDSRTLALPDLPGNRRGDSFHNILSNPHVGLLYLIPGVMTVLRINGRARILTDAPFFDEMTVKGRRPDLALVVEIDEIYLHCPASLKRSGVWAPETWENAAGKA
ncbi:MSMEG_1061 family FMN-dependent PPOX-type flavoprotein [Streptomyces sp. NPDC102441]|uniref:MSMEG_1061 family FMN-dependent PPOX-type flavoprotein n=1 Tax=Streptomyces sp. NPDC102441 TaxID=3366176 RepID=UPI00382511FC